MKGWTFEKYAVFALCLLSVGFALLCVLQILTFYTDRRLYLVFGACSLSVLLWISLNERMRLLRRGILLLATWGVLIEGTLQVVALFGLLPGVNISYPIPYSRLYWTKEGFSNGLRNSMGFHYPKSRFASDVHRVAILGDSFVEAVQVSERENLGVLLEKKLCEEKIRCETEVIGFGESGYGPAHYYELLKLVVQDSAPNEVILLFYLGNDFRNLLQEVQETPPGDYIYYRNIGESKDIELDPGSAAVVSYLGESWQRYRNRPFADLPRSLATYLISTHLVRQIPGLIANYRKVEKEDAVSRGISDFVFEDSPRDLSIKAFSLNRELLRKMADLTRDKGVRLRVVTVPFFPRAFFTAQSVADWDLRYEGYDYLSPERELANQCAAFGIDFLPMGETFRREGWTSERIEKLFFANGQGHFTPDGHQHYADVISKRWFQKN